MSSSQALGRILASVLVVALVGPRSAAAEQQAADPVVKKEWKEGDGAARAERDAMEGKAPPELAVKNWMNGKEMKLAELRGKVVLLDFWATWCGPCIAAIPHTNALQEKYAEKGLVIIGICHTQGSQTMGDVVKQKGIAYPVAADVDGATVAAFRVNSYPDYYFIDRGGKLRIADCRNGAVEEAIEALLAEPEPQETAAAGGE